MSDTDSFINEVTEEVRRDQLFVYLRKYGWIAVVAVLLIVGGAAYNEYRKASETSLAQATGDALVAALTQDNDADRAAMLADIEVEGPSEAVTGLLTAATQQEAGDLAAAVDTLNMVAINPDAPQIYRDVAAFKALLIRLPDEDVAGRRAALDALAQPGAPFALLAQEQLAIMDIEAGDITAAIAKLNAISEDAGVTRGLLERTQTLIVALGGDGGSDDTDETASE